MEKLNSLFKREKKEFKIKSINIYYKNNIKFYVYFLKK